MTTSEFTNGTKLELDTATHILGLIQKTQHMLNARQSNGTTLELTAASGSNGTTTSIGVGSSVEIYSREIIRLAMQFNRQQALTFQEWMVILMYGLIVIVSLFGNLIVCKVILCQHSMRKRTTNVFIANLTISDLLMTIFTIPMFIVRNIMNNWPFGQILCKMLPLVQAISVYVSVISMVMIAIDRYQALVRPFKNRINRQVSRPIMIGAIWFISTLFAIPNSIFNTVVEIKMLNTIIPINNDSTRHTIGTDNDEVLFRCKTVYPDDSHMYYQRLLTCLAFSTQFFIPLMIVAVCYTIIGLKISKRTCIGETTVEQAHSHLCAKRKTIKMLVFVVVVFACCWMPYNLLYIFKDFYDIDFSLSAHYITHWLAMSSVCLNPFIYFWLNNGYRKGLRSMLSCCYCFSSYTAPILQNDQPQANQLATLQWRSLNSNRSFKQTNCNFINNFNSMQSESNVQSTSSTTGQVQIIYINLNDTKPSTRLSTNFSLDTSKQCSNRCQLIQPCCNNLTELIEKKINHITNINESSQVIS